MALKREHFLFWIVAVCVFLIDRIAKLFIVKTFSRGEFVSVLPFFRIVRIHNTGTLFGLFQNGKWFFLILSIIVIIFILVKHSSFVSRIQTILALVLGGAASNVFDRIFYGYVIDFLDFRIWPAFNFADAAITVAVFLLFFEILLKKRLKRK